MQQLWLWRECGGGVLKEQGCWLGDRPSSFIARWVRLTLLRFEQPLMTYVFLYSY